MFRHVPNGRRAVLLLLVAAALTVLFILSRPREERQLGFRVGSEEVVFDWSRDACEPVDIPDSPARAFRDARGRVQLIASHYVVRRMIGPRLDDLRRDCRILMRSHEDPDPANFDDREWITSLYTADGTTIFALVHMEYQGHRHPGRCPSGEYRDCWYNAITFALSTDVGDTYRHARPPAHLVASAPYPYVPGRGPYGIFNPRNIVRDPHSGFFYVLFRMERHHALERGVSVMRTRRLVDPQSWRAWNGWEFAVEFADPHRGGEFDPRRHVPRPVARLQLRNMATSLTWNTYLGRWLLLGMETGRPRAPGHPTPGIYYSLSDDLLRWTPRRLLVQAELPWTYEPGDPNPIAYPSALDPDSPSRSFETTDQQFFVFFTRFNRRGAAHPDLDRDLVRVPVEIVPPQKAASHATDRRSGIE